MMFDWCRLDSSYIRLVTQLCLGILEQKEAHNIVKRAVHKVNAQVLQSTRMDGNQAPEMGPLPQAIIIRLTCLGLGMGEPCRTCDVSDSLLHC